MTAPSISPPAVNPWQAHTVKIRKLIREGLGVTTYYLALTEGAAMPSFKAGQFGMLYLPSVGESPIGICSDPGDHETWAFTVREAGNTTRGLAALAAGDTFGMRGPFGSCWPLEESRQSDIVIAAGGLGLPPLRPVIYEYLRRRKEFGRLTVLYGARTPDTLIYAHEYASWQQQGIDVQTTVDRASLGWTGNVGVVPLLLDRLATLDPQRTVVMTCGPEVMMNFVVRSALKRGVPVERIWVSMERNMQCAIGLCGHCQFGPEFICKDGPVFRYDRVAPWLSVEAF
jgi:NAD(P)H-flavin reductase